MVLRFSFTEKRVLFQFKAAKDEIPCLFLVEQPAQQLGSWARWAAGMLGIWDANGIWARIGREYAGIAMGCGY